MVSSMKHPPKLSSASDENEKLAKMVEMGFSIEASLDALRANNHDVEKACMALTEQAPEATNSQASPKLKAKSGPSRW